jgi:hypothetical protein
MSEVMRLCDHCKLWSWMNSKSNYCPRCDHRIDKKRMRGGDGVQIIHDRKPYWSDNMGHEPVYVDGRAQYREELRRRGLRCQED